MLADYCSLSYNDSISYYKGHPKISKYKHRYLYRRIETFKIAIAEQSLDFFNFDCSIRNMRCRQENTTISRYGDEIPTLKYYNWDIPTSKEGCF